MEQLITEYIRKNIDLAPRCDNERFGLRRPIYRAISNYGHMGREDLIRSVGSTRPCR